MATFSKVPLSGASYGLAVKVAATASTGTTIHATGTSATTVDEIWLFAFNSATTPTLLTIQFGGTTAPDQNIVITIPAQSGLTVVVPGLILLGTGGAASTVYAFAAVANVVTLSGFVNRVTA